MYSKFDIETVTLENLVKYPNHWFYRTELAFLVGEQYQLVGKYDEFYFGHFCFVWEKLQTNQNFIITREQNGEKQIKFISANSHISNFYPNFDNININLVLDFKSQIKHMTEFPELYYGSNIIKKFLVNNFGSDAENMYNFYELYLDNDNPNNDSSNKNKLLLSQNNAFLLSLCGAVFSFIYYFYKF
jgi:hypothetical protein